jgi:SEFIR domain
MIASIELRLGDLFDGPSDLIVLPCSTTGTITRFVANRLIEYSIPAPRPAMKLGQLGIVAFRGAENIAQYVGFAASVAGTRSTARAIQSIGEAIGNFTRQASSVRFISAPLLGTGAGGLPSNQSFSSLIQGFRSTAANDAKLVIHVLDSDVFSKLHSTNKNSDSSPDTGSRSLRVFISYSGTSPKHKQWVATLATYLRTNGIDARLDQWHLRKGMDLPQWMTNELHLSERVIIISDSRYTDRADKRHGGVGWETMLIQGDISQLPPDTQKYIVIVRENEFSKGLPIYLRTRFCLHWADDSDENEMRTDLLRELYNVELAPPLGTRLLL